MVHKPSVPFPEFEYSTTAPPKWDDLNGLLHHMCETIWTEYIA